MHWCNHVETKLKRCSKPGRASPRILLVKANYVICTQPSVFIFKHVERRMLWIFRMKKTRSITEFIEWKESCDPPTHYQPIIDKQMSAENRELYDFNIFYHQFKKFSLSIPPLGRINMKLSISPNHSMTKWNWKLIYVGGRFLC